MLSSFWLRATLVLGVLRAAGGVAGFAVGPPESAGVPAAPFPAWVYLALVATYSGSAALLMYGARRDRRAVELAFVFLFVSSAFSNPLLQMLEAHAESPYRYGAGFLLAVRVEAFLPLFLWRFVGEFPRVVSDGRARRSPVWITRVAAATGGILFAGNIVGWALSPGRAAGLSTVLAILDADSPTSQFWTAVIVLAIPAYPFAYLRRRFAESEERIRVGWFLTCLLGGSLPVLVQILLESLIPAYGRRMAEPATRRAAGAVIYTLMLSMPLATAYALLLRHVFDARLVVRQALQYALARITIMLATSLPFAGLLLVLYQNRSRSLAEVISGTRPLLLLAATVVGAVMLRMRRGLLLALDTHFFREQHDARQILVQLAERSRAARSLKELAELLRQEIDRALHVRSIDLLTLDADRRHYSAPSEKMASLDADSALAVLIGGNADPLEVDLGDPGSPLRRLPQRERTWLETGRVSLICPLIGTGGTLLGLITLGEKQSELPFSKEDRLLLTAISAASALVVENRLIRESDPRRDVLAPSGSEDAETTLPMAAASPPVECGSCQTVHPPGTERCSRCGGALGASRAPSLLVGRFRVERCLGSGGMGVVYLARDQQLKRWVALKFLPADLSRDSTARSRFLREARAASLLDHPNIGTIYEIVEGTHGISIAMAYYEGVTLRERLRRGAPDSSESVGILGQLLSGLEAAHWASVVHRDLKPANVMLRPDGQVKILDFGLAKVELADGEETPLTEAGAMLGTVAYMSPEQARALDVDHRTDLWSLGVIAYEMLTGRNPFDAGNKAGTIGRILTMEPVPLAHVRPELPAALTDLVRGLLEKRASDRIPDASAARTLLQRARFESGGQ